MSFKSRRSLLLSIATGISSYTAFRTAIPENSDERTVNETSSEDDQGDTVKSETYTDEDPESELEGVEENGNSSRNDTPTDTPDSDVDEGQHLTVSIEEVDDVFEGTIEYVSFTIENPTDETVTEHITVERDSYTTLYDDLVTVAPGETVEESTQWHIRNDAAGHSMRLIVSGSEDTDETLVSGRPNFYPSINDVPINSDNETATVEFTIENSGSAPGSHDIEIAVDDTVQFEDTVSLGIDESKTATETVPVSADEHEISVSTEVSTEIEIITVD